MRFLVDAQLPPALARLLAAKGFEAQHVYDIELGAAEDRLIWDHAMKSGAVIISKDEDFISMITLHGDGPAIVWIRLGNTSKKSMLNWFEPLIPEIIASLQRGEKLIEVV
jgi:predicted nuclease of predicted toxin-antitoxin system